MKTESMLPSSIEGKWIWCTVQERHDRTELLLKRDFSLFEMPGVVELWVATHSFYKIFINGRMAILGPTPHPGGGKNAFAVKIDITHLVEVGVNTITVLAHNENTALQGKKRTLEGLWLQVDVDEKPIAWSDGEWIAKQTQEFVDTGLRTAPCDVYVENMDLRLVDRNTFLCQAADLANSDEWKKVDMVKEVSPENGMLVGFGVVQTLADAVKPKEMSFRGICKQEREVTNISFAGAIARKRELGTYAAISYVYMPMAQKNVAVVICDEPYMLFINNRKVKEQAVPKVQVRAGSTSYDFHELAPHELEEQSCEVQLVQGWNRIVFVQHCASYCSGALMVWPELAPTTLKLTEKPAINSPEGWNVVGALQAPMSMIYPSFPFEELIKTHYEFDEKQVTDISAYYLACSFAVSPDAEKQLPIALGNKEYAIFDFDKTQYAFPHITLNGSAGDVVDLVFGELCQNGEVIAYEIGVRRNASTITLADGENEWMCSTPRGFRYVMVICRNVRNKVEIKAVDFHQCQIEHKNTGSFQCSSPVLDNVWNIGVSTLETTMRNIYIDSPAKGQSQSLPDAMIQSWAGYSVFGEFDQAGRAIEAFAQSQLETGEINAISPSGIFQALPDYSLCWPVWLHRHFQYTGDEELLMRMMPTLKKLMFYYNEIATEPDGPLGDLRDYLGLHPFIDYGDIERGGISTALNAFYCRALLSAAMLATQAGMEDLAELYRNRATSVAHKVWVLNWNDEAGMFADSNKRGRQSTKCSWQSSLLAIYGGIAKPQHYERIWNKLFTIDAPLEKHASGEYNNPYFKYYILETAFALGKSPWALSLIHYYWGAMAKAGAKTWWEMFDPQLPDQQNRICGKCQGYGVSPNSFIISELVGIRPAEPGMRMVYFNPMPGDVSWVKASIPTPQGTIKVYWNLDDSGLFKVTINSNYVLEVVPVMAPGIAKSCVFNVNDKVSILTPEQ